jgi:succinate dehydrogenase / fumarate reductase membrane anchor subunit
VTARSPLGSARGLGSARTGVQQWWLQRVTALALVPLCLWLGVSLIALVGADHARFSAWVADPAHAIGLLLTLGTAFYHFKIGVDEVIEDYVHAEAWKLAARLSNTFGVTIAAAASGFAILKLAL